MDPGIGEATVIDPVTAKVLATVAIGGSLEFAVPDGRGRMYVNIEDKNEVAVLDTRARKLVSRFPLAGCDWPTGIAYDPAAGELVSAWANGVSVVSTLNGRRRARLAVGR